MSEEPAEARRVRGQVLIDLSREDLELLGVSELEERVEALEAEAARCRAQMGRKQAVRSAADALFTRRE
ncbi:MAG TPA: DUF1192 domain-containing protein [Caulobacteraceae bacterium]